MGTLPSFISRGEFLTDAHILPSKSLSLGEKKPYLIVHYSDRGGVNRTTPITDNHCKYA
jgi:hypothetical protein